MGNTFYVFWQYEGDRFSLAEWESNSEHAEQFSKVFWPSIDIKHLKDSVLLECHEKQTFIECDVSNQNLAVAESLPFKVVYIKAVPARSVDYGDYIEVEYTVGE